MVGIPAASWSVAVRTGFGNNNIYKTIPKVKMAETKTIKTALISVFHKDGWTTFLPSCMKKV